jgi:hypothetical protein
LGINQRAYRFGGTERVKLLDFVCPSSESRTNQKMGCGIKMPAIWRERSQHFELSPL